MKRNFSLVFLIIALLVACQTQTQETRRPQVRTIEADSITSFLGSELLPKDFPDGTRSKYEKQLDEAKANYDTYPDSVELIIWYGRRLAYLGKYLEAIKVYSEGIAKYPTSHRLRRHRGHRFITIRQIDKAIADFELAAFNSTNIENRIEPDGLPNKIRRPISNDKFNIYYHFGLAHYLNGRFDKAVSAYKKCMEFSDNSDLVIATTYWLYLSARRIGNDDLANEILGKISSRMKVIENYDYMDLLLFFKGEISEKFLLSKTKDPKGIINPTISYGIGTWYLLNSRIDEARSLFWQTLESPNWDAFGYIATESEIANMATSSY